MDEPPAKRARRTDSAAMWDKNDASNRSTASPRSPRPHDSQRDARSRHESYHSKRDDDRRRRSRSPQGKQDRNKRARSRSPREKPYGERDRDRNRDRGRDEGGHRDRKRSRSRSRDQHRSSKDYRSDRKRGRSQSPHRNGEATASFRRRTPPRPRVKAEDREFKENIKHVEQATNGTSDVTRMDEDDVDAAMKKLMGFSTFKTTQNTKVPGNQIYGVRKEKKTEYRQYMNRVGGFNRPLSPG